MARPWEESLGLSLSALLQHYHSCPFQLIFHRLALVQVMIVSFSA